MKLLTLKHVGKPQTLFIFPHAFSGQYRREVKFNQQLHCNPRETKLQPKSWKCSGKESESHFGVTGLCREAFPPGFNLREWEGWEAEEGVRGRGAWMCVHLVGRGRGGGERDSCFS